MPQFFIDRSGKSAGGLRTARGTEIHNAVMNLLICEGLGILPLLVGYSNITRDTG